MKKLLSILIAVVLLFTVAGCAEEVSRKPVDVRYTAAYESVETNYVHKYDWYVGDFVMVPEIQTVHHGEEYSICYEITYDDGSTRRQWQDCTYAEYTATQKRLQEGFE